MPRIRITFLDDSASSQPHDSTQILVDVFQIESVPQMTIPKSSFGRVRWHDWVLRFRVLFSVWCASSSSPFFVRCSLAFSAGCSSIFLPLLGPILCVLFLVIDPSSWSIYPFTLRNMMTLDDHIHTRIHLSRTNPQWTCFLTCTFLENNTSTTGNGKGYHFGEWNWMTVTKRKVWRVLGGADLPPYVPRISVMGPLLEWVNPWLWNTTRR